MLDTLAVLPGDAHKYVELADWEKMSQHLIREWSERQVPKLFYPEGASEERLCASSRRRRGFLLALDNSDFWKVYQCILQHRDLRFPELHRLCGLSEEEGKILPQVMNHVLDWLGGGRIVTFNKRDNKKPPLRNELDPALGHISPELLRQAKRRVDIVLEEDIGHNRGRPTAETASIIMQQEILEFVHNRLSAFKEASLREDLAQVLEADNANAYRRRFMKVEWAGVLRIVRTYIGSGFGRNGARLANISRKTVRATERWRDQSWALSCCGSQATMAIPSTTLPCGGTWATRRS